MTPLGWIIVVVGAVIVGAIAQWVVKNGALRYRWVITSIGAFLGAAVASEMLFAGGTPDIEGIAVWPALVGGLVVGALVDLIAQYYGKHVEGGQGHGAAIR